jgi:hypothetical protein
VRDYLSASIVEGVLSYRVCIGLALHSPLSFNALRLEVAMLPAQLNRISLETPFARITIPYH